MKAKTKEPVRTFSFWDIREGDPVVIRNNHPIKAMQGLRGAAAEQSQHSNGFGMAVEIKLPIKGKIKRFRMDARYVSLIGNTIEVTEGKGSRKTTRKVQEVLSYNPY